MGEVATLKDGQVYRWRYRDGIERSYWCKSRIAIVENGALFDTYWCSPVGRDDINLEDVDITLLCDQTWQKIDAWQIDYYDPSDIADTRHENDTRAPIYLRPGAKRSAAWIAARLGHAEERANSGLRTAQRRLEWLQEQRALLEAGRLDEVSL